MSFINHINNVRANIAVLKESGFLTGISPAGSVCGHAVHYKLFEKKLIIK